MTSEPSSPDSTDREPEPPLHGPSRLLALILGTSLAVGSFLFVRALYQREVGDFLGIPLWVWMTLGVVFVFIGLQIVVQGLFPRAFTRLAAERRAERRKRSSK